MAMCTACCSDSKIFTSSCKFLISLVMQSLIKFAELNDFAPVLTIREQNTRVSEALQFYLLLSGFSFLFLNMHGLPSHLSGLDLLVLDLKDSSSAVWTVQNELNFQWSCLPSATPPPSVSRGTEPRIFLYIQDWLTWRFWHCCWIYRVP